MGGVSLAGLFLGEMALDVTGVVLSGVVLSGVLFGGVPFDGLFLENSGILSEPRRVCSCAIHETLMHEIFVIQVK